MKFMHVRHELWMILLVCATAVLGQSSVKSGSKSIPVVEIERDCSSCESRTCPESFEGAYSGQGSLSCSRAYPPKYGESIQKIIHQHDELYWENLELSYGRGFMSRSRRECVGILMQGLNIKNQRILDFGSGLGELGNYLIDRGAERVLGVDTNPVIVSQAKMRLDPSRLNKIELKCVNPGEALPCPDASIDIIFCKLVLTYLNEEEKIETFREFYRVLAPGGYLVISDLMLPRQNETPPELTDGSGDIVHHYFNDCTKMMSLMFDQSFYVLRYQDWSQQQIQYYRDVLEYLSLNAADFIGSLGEPEYIQSRKSYARLAHALNQRRLVYGVFQAFKPNPGQRLDHMTWVPDQRVDGITHFPEQSLRSSGAEKECE